ncbi:MAG: MMPL family transporter [Sulfitobacter sp.]
MTLAEKLTDALFRHNRLAVLLFAAFIAFMAAGIPRLGLESGSRAFFDEGNLEYIDVLNIEDTYTVSNTLLMMVAPPKGTAFTPESLNVLRQMTEDAWQMPYVLRVDAAINHMHSFSEGEDIFVEPMLDEFDDITDDVAARFRTLAMSSKSLRNTLLSETGDAFGIVIRIVLPDDQPDARNEVEMFLNQMRDTWETSYPDWDIRASGSLLGNSLLGKVAIEDIYHLVPLALGAVLVLFVLALGSFLAVGAALAVLGSATIATFGFAGWTNVALTAGTAISPLAVMVLVSTSCVHLTLSTIRAAESGVVKDPLSYAVTHNLAPITVSHLTTAFGFLCLNFAPAPPLANMGNIVAFGLLVGHVAVFVLLSAWLRKHPPTRAGRLMISGENMRRFARSVSGNSRIWVIAFPLAGLLAVIGIFRIDYDDNVIRYFDERYEFRQDAEQIQNRLTGLDVLQFPFAAPEGTSVFDPEFLRAIDRFAVWLEAQPNVVAVNGLTNIIKDLNQSMSGDDPDAYVIGATQPANAQLLMFYELSLPVGMDLNVMMDVDRTQTLLTATLRAAHSAEVRTLAANAESWLNNNEPLIATRASGLGLAFARISQRNNSQMLYGFVTILGLVSLTLIVALRSLRFGLLSLVPNLMPALLAFGFWGLTVRDVNLGSTVVTTMTFGIVVDDTVHFLMHYLRCRRSKMDVQAALEDTFTVVGSSIVLTSVALIMGFGIMAASGFSINQHIGLLTAVVIMFALLSDLLFLPALLKTFQGRSS